MSKETYEKQLEEQKRLGFPKFKQAIAKALYEHHGINMDIAKEAVYRPDVQARIDRDMVWSQHMGAEYWAEEIMFLLNRH